MTEQAISDREIGLARIRQLIQPLQTQNFDPRGVDWASEVQHYLRVSLHLPCTTILLLNRQSSRLSAEEFIGSFQTSAQKMIDQLTVAGHITQFLICQANNR